jgi:hypothetical protein
MDTRGSFPGSKAAGAWNWPLTSIWCGGQRMRGSIPPLPNTPSWRDAQLKHRDYFTLTLEGLIEPRPTKQLPIIGGLLLLIQHILR